MYATLGFKVAFGKKEAPLRTGQTSYTAKMRGAMNERKVVFSDTDSHRHWLFDGATAILHFCLASLMETPTSDQNPNARIEMRLPDQTTPISSFNALVDPHNRQILWTEKGRSFNAPSTAWAMLEDLVLQCYEPLEQYYDRLHPSGPSKHTELSLRGRVQEGYEFRDIITSTRSSLRQLRLGPEADPWYNWLRKIKMLNFFGFGFGDLIQTEGAFHSKECPLIHGMPTGCDFLTAPIGVLEIIAERAGLHTK